MNEESTLEEMNFNGKVDWWADEVEEEEDETTK